MHIDLTNGVVELRDKEKGVLGMLADTLAWFKELIGFSKHEEEDTVGALGKKQNFYSQESLFRSDPVKLHELEAPHRSRPLTIKELSLKTG